jgi:hypothetical protein
VARVPRRYRGRDIHEWSVELGLYDQARIAQHIAATQKGTQR